MTRKDGTKEAMAERLKQVWRENQEIVAGRLAILREAARAAGEGRLLIAEREEAKVTAHKLAGSLGMFGLWEASECARAIETHLEQAATDEPCRIDGLVESLERLLERTPEK